MHLNFKELKDKTISPSEHQFGPSTITMKQHAQSEFFSLVGHKKKATLHNFPFELMLFKGIFPF